METREQCPGHLRQEVVDDVYHVVHHQPNSHDQFWEGAGGRGGQRTGRSEES